MRTAELKSDKTIPALAKRLLKEFHSNTSAAELEATLLRLNPHLSRIARLEEGTPILLPPSLTSRGETTLPLAHMAGEMMRQAEGALRDLRAALLEDAAHVAEEAEQAQVWLKSEQGRKTVREIPELKEQFAKVVTAAKKATSEQTALLAAHDKSLQKLRTELAKFHRQGET